MKKGIVKERYISLFSFIIVFLSLVCLSGCDEVSKNGSKKKLADYDKYSSSKNEKELLDTFVLFEGEVGKVISEDGDEIVPGVTSLNLQITQDDGKEWLVYFQPEPITIKVMLQDLHGEKVRVLGKFQGVSETYGLPIVHIYDADCYIKDSKNDTEISWTRFTSDYTTWKQWCDENQCELLVEDIVDSDNQMRLCKSKGIIYLDTDNSYRIYTMNKDNSIGQYCFYKKYRVNTRGFCIEVEPESSRPYYEPGDAITVYYMIGFDNNPYIFSVQDETEIGISIDDINKQYGSDSDPAIKPKETTKETEDSNKLEVDAPKTETHTNKIKPKEGIAIEGKVWVTRKGKKYHKDSTCGNMKDPKAISKKEAEDQGYKPCKKCF